MYLSIKALTISLYGYYNVLAVKRAAQVEVKDGLSKSHLIFVRRSDAGIRELCIFATVIPIAVDYAETEQPFAAISAKPAAGGAGVCFVHPPRCCLAAAAGGGAVAGD